MISKHTIKVEVELEVDISYSWTSGDPSVNAPSGPEEIEVEAIRGLRFQYAYYVSPDGSPSKMYFIDAPDNLQKNFRAYFDDKVMEQIKDQLEDYANRNPPEPEINYGG